MLIRRNPWSRFKTDPAALVDQHLTALDMTSGQRSCIQQCTYRSRVSCVDLNDGFVVSACIALWRSLAFPDSSTIVFVANNDARVLWLSYVLDLVHDSSADVGSAVTFSTASFKSNLSQGLWDVIVMTPEELVDRSDYSTFDHPTTLLVPDLDAVPGCRVRAALDLVDSRDLTFACVAPCGSVSA